MSTDPFLHGKGNRDEVLSTVVTADEALSWVVVTTLAAEAEYTETHNEDRTLADYLSDMARVLDRIVTGDGYDSLVPVRKRPVEDEPDSPGFTLTVEKGGTYKEVRVTGPGVRSAGRATLIQAALSAAGETRSSIFNLSVTVDRSEERATIVLFTD